jgi:hypothetical protein
VHYGRIFPGIKADQHSQPHDDIGNIHFIKATIIRLSMRKSETEFTIDNIAIDNQIDGRSAALSVLAHLR